MRIRRHHISPPRCVIPPITITPMFRDNILELQLRQSKLTLQLTHHVCHRHDTRNCAGSCASCSPTHTHNHDADNLLRPPNPHRPPTQPRYPLLQPSLRRRYRSRRPRHRRRLPTQGFLTSRPTSQAPTARQSRNIQTGRVLPMDASMALSPPTADWPARWQFNSDT